MELCETLDYNAVKLAILKACDIADVDGKVIKIRNLDRALIPPTQMLDEDNPNNTFIVDIAKITCQCM